MNKNVSQMMSVLLNAATTSLSIRRKYGYNESTTALASWKNLEEWKTTMFAMEVIIYIVACIHLWVLTSTIVYGTKTGRWWKKPGTSSLGNGKIFVACVGAITLTIPKLVIVILLYQAPKRDDDNISCDGILYVSPFMYFASLYSTYLFLWILQRQIYCHPLVKKRVNDFTNLFSKYFVVVLTVGFGVMGTCFWVFGQPVYSTNDCMVQDQDLERKVVIPLTVGAVLLQVVMVVLCLYPAFRARFHAVHSTSSSDRHRSLSVSEESQASSDDENSFKRFLINISYSRVVVSPIQAHVRRSVISALVILLSDIVASIINICIPKDAPVQVQWFSYDVNLLVNVFCMLATFGYASQIFSLFCPTTLVTTRRIGIKKNVRKSWKENDA